MSRQDDRSSSSILGDQFPYGTSTQRIETAADFIEQKKVRPASQSTSKLELPLLAAGKVLRVKRDLRPEVTSGQKLEIGFRLAVFWRSLDSSPEGNVLRLSVIE